MQKITPHLWFKGNAEEAVSFYLSVFPSAKILTTTHYPTAGLLDFQKDFAGKVLTISFKLFDSEFVAINAGNEFSPNPANSFMVNFDPGRDSKAKENLEAMWSKLIVGGKALMPLQKYDFSQLYGWVEDKYGFSWQLILTDPEAEARPTIIPSLMFTGSKPQAVSAVNFYKAVFKNSKAGEVYFYNPTQMPGMQNMVMFTDFTLENQWFTAADGGSSHNFSFSEAVSYNVACRDQAEIDYYWEKLTTDGGSESMCGWCKDKFGVSWQINPENIDALVNNPTAWSKLLEMKKIDIQRLEAA